MADRTLKGCFLEHGYPAFLAIEDWDDSTPAYHRVTDTLTTLDLGYYANVARAAIGAIEGCTGKRVEVVVGKPSAITARAILDRLQLPASECIIVGDRLETDIRMGREAGMATAVVLTGVTTPEVLAVSEVQPDYVLHRLDELLPLQALTKETSCSQSTSFHTPIGTANGT